MRILAVNPNSDERMTRAIEAELTRVKDPGTELTVEGVPGNPVAIETALDEVRSFGPMLEAIARARDVDGVLITYFSDPATEAVRELTRAPVIGTFQASLRLAAQLGEKVTVLVPNTGPYLIPGCDVQAVRDACGSSFASYRTVPLTVSQTVQEPVAAVARCAEVGRRAIAEDGSDVFVLGCGGFGYLAPELRSALGTPVVGPDAAGLKTLEAVIGLDLTHRARRAADERAATAKP